PSAEYIVEHQARLAAMLDRAIERSPEIDLETLNSCGAEPPMALAYQGRDIRPIIERYAALLTERISVIEPKKVTGKPRVGIVVTHGHEGVFARCWGGIVERLSREKLDVRVACSRAGANVLKQMIRVAHDEYLVLPARLDQA